MPHAVHVVGVINKGIIPQNCAVFVNGIDVKQKHAAGVHKKRDFAKRRKNAFFVRQVAKPVERADRGVHGAVQIKRRHILAQKQNVLPGGECLVLRFRKHFG